MSRTKYKIIIYMISNTTVDSKGISRAYFESISTKLTR